MLVSDLTVSLPSFDFEGVTIQAWQIVILLVAVVAIITIPFIVFTQINKANGEKFTITTRDITYGSICLAMSYVLSFFGFEMPFGGTVTFASILPISIYCYYFDYRKGAVCCIIYMVLQLLQHPWIVSVWSALLDYVIPYFALSLAGALSYNHLKANKANGTKLFALVNHKGYFIGMAIYIIIRYTCHVVSGAIFWDYSADYGMSTIPYSMAYNAFCLVDFAIAIVAAFGLLSSKTFDTLMRGTIRRPSSKKFSVQCADGSVSTQSNGLANSNADTKND